MEKEKQENGISRRQALKTLAATGGAIAASTLIPSEWSKPVVEAGVLPAHAQQLSPTPEPTPEPCEGDMCAIAITTTMVETENGGDRAPAALEYGDFDFSLCTPNGHYVWGGSSGDGATSSDDNIDFDPHVDNETLNISIAVPGVYSIYLEHYEQVPLAMTVRIITAAGVHDTSFTLNETRAVADVTFPGGIVTWRSDLGDPGCVGDRDSSKGK